MSANEDLPPPPPSYQNISKDQLIDRISTISEQLPAYLELIPLPAQQPSVRRIERNQKSSDKKHILPLFHNCKIKKKLKKYVPKKPLRSSEIAAPIVTALIVIGVLAFVIYLLVHYYKKNDDN